MKLSRPLIDKWSAEGWKFCHLADVTTIRTNGCLAGLFGNPTSVVTVQVAVLEKG